MTKYVVEDHHFWIAARKFDWVWRWARRHEPRGTPSEPLAIGVLKNKNGKTLERDMLVFFQDQRDVTHRWLSIALAPARDGGTAIRADGIAVGEPRPHHPPCFGTGY